MSSEVIGAFFAAAPPSLVLSTRHGRRVAALPPEDFAGLFKEMNRTALAGSIDQADPFGFFITEV
jgi:hypothetical protein